MKQYLVFNIEQEKTRFFSCCNLPTAKAKVHMLNWDMSNVVVCHEIDDWYEPVLQVHCPQLKAFEAHAQLTSYLSKYLLAISCLPPNFPTSIRLRKSF